MSETESPIPNDNVQKPDQGLQELLESCRTEIEFIKSAKPDIDATRISLEQAQKSAAEQSATANGFRKEMDEARTNAAKTSKTLKKSFDDLSKRLIEAEKKCAEAEALNAKIVEIEKAGRESLDSVVSSVSAIGEAKISFETLKGEAQQKVEELQATTEELQELIDEVKKQHDEIDELHGMLLLDDKDDDGKIISASVKSKILELKTYAETEARSIVNTHKDIVEDTKVLKGNLEQEIRSLLPSAGAAGLSSAYHDAKGRYNEKWATAVFYAMFILPLLAISYMYYDILKNLDVNILDKGVLANKLLITVPLGLVSWFGHSSIRLGRRLYEEYNHKQRVMQLYHSFKKEVDQHGTEEHKRKLLEIMLEAVKDKPSLTMSKYDKGIGEEISPFAAMLNFPRKKEDVVDTPLAVD